MTVENLLIKVKTSENAKKPTKSGAGYILYANETTVIKKDTKSLITSGVSMTIPVNYYGQLHILDKHISDLKLLGGVIDSDYRGEIRVILYNESENDFTVNEGDPICKIIFVKINTNQIKHVESLDGSERGSDGFGSTGI